MEPKTKKYLIIGGIVILLAIIGNLSREEEKKSRTPQDESVFMKEERPSMVDSRNQLCQNCDSLRGIKPEQSRSDGSVQVVKDYIEENAKYPRSIRYKEWSKVTDFGEFWVVRCKFKGKNSLGNITDNDMWFYIQNGQVVKMSTK
jgi:hypothetical protein